MITSLLDNDLYKFTMMQVVWRRFRDVPVEYRLISRSQSLQLNSVVDQLRQQIAQYCNLNLTTDELNYLADLPYFSADFIDYLASFKLNPAQITLDTDAQHQLSICGPWVNTILFEVPLLAMISEMHYAHYYPNYDMSEARTRLQQKIELIKQSALQTDFHFVDFGTRRRFSHAWHAELVGHLQRELPQQFVGTSNVYLAKKYALRPVGTMAHEYLQAFQQIASHLSDSQKMALTTWLDEYNQHLGIALTDTIGLSAFLHDFDNNLANAYSGVRQDSGDPLQWAEAMLAHYRSLGIEPKDKSLVFSDGLNFNNAIQLYHALHKQTKVLFGIGTHLTNDVGLQPLDIVIKMWRCHGKPVAKISDTPAKALCCDQAYLQRLQRSFTQTDISNEGL